MSIVDSIISSFLDVPYHIKIAHMLKAYVSGNKTHKSPIHSLKVLLLSRILIPSGEPNHTVCENSQLKNRWSIVFVSFLQRGHKGSMV